MPELPEVEITTRNLIALMSPSVVIKKFIFFRKNLRNLIPIRKIKHLEGQELIKIYRRAKFIIFKFEKSYLLSHLGMTGSWRKEVANWQKRKHDHVVIQISENSQFIYNDPRRFGEFHLLTPEQLENRFAKFGPEPLDVKTEWTRLTEKFRQLAVPIKIALMNQNYLVGVGNIYANEALHRAGIRPQKKACQITKKEYEKLWSEVIKVLTEAINEGGSSIQDFRNGYGEKGAYQKKFLVYSRAGQPCLICSSEIKVAVIGGRSSFWCKQCQN